ncbi:MAG: hypothetical protein EPO25_09035 [Gammaproteobacteria bacterium]|nr:MAG: hypothetical protein EPO25_09035 [Gammaproteobacteria bacterium]
MNEDDLQRLAARTTAEHMKLRRQTIERPLAEIKWRIFVWKAVLQILGNPQAERQVRKLPATSSME